MMREVHYPVLVAPRYRGVRVSIIGGRARRRHGGPVVNRCIQDILGGLPAFIGMVTVGGPTSPTVLDDTLDAIDNPDGFPSFTYWAIDLRLNTEKLPLLKRLELLDSWVASANSKNVRAVKHELARNARELGQLEFNAVRNGFSGVVLRDPNQMPGDRRHAEKSHAKAT